VCLVSFSVLFLLLSTYFGFQTAVESSVASYFDKITIKRFNVIIDPGHGGIDGGAVGITGVNEKDINLQISLKLKHIMSLLGIVSEYTRTTDITLGNGENTIAEKKISDMRKRLELINAQPYNLMLSIHTNFYPEEKYWGPQVFYSENTDSGKIYAESIQNALKEFVMHENLRKAKKALDEIYLLKNAHCPALIVECGFLSNYNEELLLQTDDHQIKIASAIVAGILNSNCYTKEITG